MKTFSAKFLVFMVFSALSACSACDKSSQASTQTAVASSPEAEVTAPLKSCFIQLQGSDKATYDPKYDFYIVDLFDATDAFIAQAHKDNKKVIAYFSAGSWEDWRTDIGSVAPEAIGKVYVGFPNEKWLDIRAASVKNLVQKRLDLAVSRGFDGVDPDNVNGYSNNTGFPLTAAHQLEFNQFIAQEAHARKLLIGLKNDLDQTADLVSSYDFAVNEQCYRFNECDKYSPFIKAKKSVFNIEYVDAAEKEAAACQVLIKRPMKAGISSIIATQDLDGSFILCP